MISAVAGEPSQSLDQFRSQFHTTGIDLKTALINFALTTDHVKKAASRLGVKDIAALIFNFFKTTAPALFAAAVPIGIYGGQISRHFFYLFELWSAAYHQVFPSPWEHHPPGAEIRSLWPLPRQRHGPDRPAQGKCDGYCDRCSRS